MHFHDPEAKVRERGIFRRLWPEGYRCAADKRRDCGALLSLHRHLQNDAMLASLRGTPEFAELLSGAKQCRDDFLAEISQTAH